ncbi:MAG: hypothetical protein K8T10_19210 [Candidatus Eremiobacteraeota bacterium]|nr:hypothetical protein [Candidatus Eremiobacteraeota bacterium]
MKRSIILFVVAVMLFSLIIPGVLQAGEKPDPARISDFAVFFKTFKSAVKNKDRTTLQKMISDDIFYSFGPMKPGAKNCIAHMDKNKLWDKMMKILNKGYAFQKEIKGYVSPPDFVEKKGYMGHRAGFTKKEGFWRMTFFVVGD